MASDYHTGQYRPDVDYFSLSVEEVLLYFPTLHCFQYPERLSTYIASEVKHRRTTDKSSEYLRVFRETT